MQATKLVNDMKDMDYKERLQKLDLSTLLHRRNRGDLIQVWKHFNTYDRSTLSSHFRPIPRVSRNHPFQLMWNRPKDGKNGLQTNLFYFRVANMWNQLPKTVVEAANIETFKARLDAAWSDNPTKYTIDVPRATEDQDLFVEAF